MKKTNTKVTDPFYCSKRWKVLREQALRRDNYMCVECMKEFALGGVAPRRASMVHHVIPREERPDLELELSNLESLCDMHHNRMHPEKGGYGGRRAEPHPAPNGMRIIKV